MRIDDDVVLQHDRVWHDRYGWGTVVEVQNGVCDVRFDGSQTLITFTDGGRYGGVKVLWWQQPILFTPRKGVDYSGLPEMVLALLKFKGWA